MTRCRDSGSFLARFSGACCAFVFLVWASAASAGVNTWTSTGPDGGWVDGLAWHPTRDGVLLASVAQRIYRSTDSGAHWTEAPMPTNTSSLGRFVVDPQNADRILASGQPVLRSTDGGMTFALATPVPGSLQVREMMINPGGTAVYASAGGNVFRSTDFAQTWVDVSVGLPGGSADYSTGLLISPADPDTLFASFALGGLFKSTNGGQSWTHLSSIPDTISRIAINPRNASQLLAFVISNSSGLWRSNDGGASWSSVASGTFFWFDFDPRVANRVLAAEYSSRRLYVSTDSGGAWLPASSIPSVQSTAGAFSYTTTGVLAVGTSEGVFYSSDGGQSATPRNAGLNGAEVRALVASRSAPFRVYASFYGGPDGVYQRATGSWQPVDLSQLFSAFTSRVTIQGLAVDPGNSSVVYAAGFAALAKTTDAGTAWTSVSPAFAANSPYHVVVDPANSQLLYAASTTAGILRSTDGGATWTARNNGLPVVGMSVPTYEVFIDPANSQRLYALQQSTDSAFRTTDAGMNWSRVAGGLPANEPVYTVAFDPVDGNRVYLGTQSGMYQSVDGGITWSVMPLPLGSLAISSILIDPVAPGTIAVVARASAFGVVRTVDYGASWERVPWGSQSDSSPPQIGVIDPAQPGNLIVGAHIRGMREYQIAPDLSVSMSGVSGFVQLGTTPTLHLTVQNKVSSLHAATDATVSLTLPATLAPGSITTSRGSCTRAGQGFTCRLGAMHVGDAVQIDLPVTAGLGSGTVTATVQAREVDAASADNSATTSVSVLPFADLRMTIASPVVADHGGSVTLNAQLTNQGPHDAINTRVTFTLAAGLVVSGGGVCTASGATIVCALGTLPAGGSASLQITPLAPAIGQYSVSAAATSNSYDTDTSNNVAGATVTVRPVTDLGIALSAPPATVTTGQAVAVTATVANLGPDPVSIAVATLSGTNLNVTAATHPGGSCAISNGAANCSLGALAAGASRTIDVSFAPVASGTAQLTGTTNSEATDGVAGNNVATLAVPVRALADMAISMTALPASLQTGQTTATTITVTNNGPDDATAVVADLTGTNLDVQAATPSTGSCTISTASTACALGAVASGASRTIAVTVAARATGAATLVATTGFEGSERSSANNTATGSVTVSAPPANGGGSGGGGGGGGALGLWGLLAMAGWAGLRRRLLIDMFSTC